jgi:hypothetical protein
MSAMTPRRLSTILLIIAVPGLAGISFANDLTGARAVAKFVDRDGSDRDRGVVRLGRDVSISAPLPDPTSSTSYLRISAGTAGTFDLPLPAARWRAAGSGYRYDGGGGGDVVDVVNFVAGDNGGAILIRTRGPLFEITDDEQPEYVELRFAVGATEYCARLEPPAAARTSRGQGRMALRGSATACRTQTHTCAIDPQASGLLIRNPAVVIPVMPTGTLTFHCEEVAGGTGAPCSCRVELDPILISGLGDLCMTPGPGCAAGRLDCAGDRGADVDVVSDHNIGICADNPGCAGSCAGRCAELGPAYEPIFSACEAFCAGGQNDGWPCAFKQDCPGGFCAGRDDGSGGRSCHCVCSASALGPPPGEPSLTCNASLGMTIEDVEIFGDGICGNGEAALTVAPLCQAMTSATATVSPRNVLDIPGFEMDGPYSIAGAAPACPTVVGGATPLRLAGNYTTFGRVTGDAIFEWSLTCAE